MTAKKLIAELRKMPANAEVGFRSHDNCEYELQGWAKGVELMRRADAEDLPPHMREQLDSMPKQWITIYC